MIDREQIGIRIAALRKKAGWSQQTLAEKLGVSPQAVSKWESGKNLPDIDVFRELAWLFHMTMCAFRRKGRREKGIYSCQYSGGKHPQRDSPLFC